MDAAVAKSETSALLRTLREFTRQLIDSGVDRENSVFYWGSRIGEKPGKDVPPPWLRDFFDQPHTLVADAARSVISKLPEYILLSSENQREREWKNPNQLVVLVQLQLQAPPVANRLKRTIEILRRLVRPLDPRRSAICNAKNNTQTRGRRDRHTDRHYPSSFLR